MEKEKKKLKRVCKKAYNYAGRAERGKG